MEKIEMTPREMLERLVAFDTTSRNSNLALIEWVADYLAAYDISASLTFDDDRRKANLFATLGTGDVDGVVLSGHTDVVPVDDQDWRTDPWVLTEADGKLYGRGTCDMKGFIAVALALVPAFLAQPLTKPVHLALSYDEEVGCFGVHRMIADVLARGVRPRAVVVGEPTSMSVVDAHKGMAAYVTEFRGVPAHSSATHIGVSATHAAARFVSHLDDVFLASQERARPDLGFVPPYTTIQAGIVNGGTATNIIAGNCTVDWHFRSIPTDDPDSIEREILDGADKIRATMQEMNADCDVATTLCSRVPPFISENASPATELALALTGSNRTTVASFGTEAGIFQANGLSAVICGPGDIAQAHQPDEFISLAQIDACTTFMHRLIERLR